MIPTTQQQYDTMATRYHYKEQEALLLDQVRGKLGKPEERISELMGQLVELSVEKHAFLGDHVVQYFVEEWLHDYWCRFSILS